MLNRQLRLATPSPATQKVDEPALVSPLPHNWHGCPGKLFVQRTRVFVHRIAIQGGRNLLPPECPPLAYFVKEAGIAAPSSKNATDASPPRSRLQPKNFPRTAVPLWGKVDNGSPLFPSPLVARLSGE